MGSPRKQPQNASKALLTLVCLCCGSLSKGCSLHRDLLFPRDNAGGAIASEPDIESVETFWIDTPQGKVEAWYLRASKRHSTPPGPAILFAHGNAELMDAVEGQLLPYRELGIPVLIGEYRGYGRSAGSPTESRIVADFKRFYDWLARRPEVDEDRIVYHGRSLGAAVVVALARERRPAAMILQSPFTSVRAMAERHLVPPCLVPDQFDNKEVLRDLRAPVLIFHGRRDEIVPVEHAREPHAVSPESTYIEHDCGHNDFPFGSERHWRDVRAFLRTHGI